MTDHNSQGAAARPTSLRTAITGTVAGQAVEWYDYLLYGYVATEIASNFFPSSSSEASLLIALGAFGATFLIRPLGGLFWGRIADRHGRAKVLTFTVVLMSVATAAFGLIPSYDSIGVWAPILVVVARLLQGFSAGGETNSCMTLIMEYTSKNRAFYLGFLTIGIAISAVTAATVTGIVSAVAGEGAYDDWAWRIPFLLAIPFGAVTLYLRLRIDETPVFTAMAEKGNLQKSPLLSALRRYKSRIPLLLILFGANAVISYYLLGFLPSYLVTTGGLTQSQASLVSVVAWVVIGIAALTFGRLTDRYGRRFIRFTSLGLIIVLAVPAVFLASTGNFVLAIVGLLFLAVPYGASQIATYTATTEMFDADVRMSAGAVSYNFAYVIFGGTAPIMGTALAEAGGPYLAGGYLVLVAAVALIAIRNLPDTDLSETESAARNPVFQ